MNKYLLIKKYTLTLSACSFAVIKVITCLQCAIPFEPSVLFFPLLPLVLVA